VWCNPRRRSEARIRTLEPRERQAPDGGQYGGHQPTESRRIHRRLLLAPVFPMHRGQKDHENLKICCHLLTSEVIADARCQPLPEAGAERTLLAVGCTPWFGEPRPSLYSAARFWTPLSYIPALCPTTHSASFGIHKPPSAVAYGCTAAATARQMAACSGAEASASMARVLADVA
jgi:hypothetical protein